ncbi:MAG TPA: ATP-binding protein [Terriglobales bacterium]|jgi:signal transduction histidine kinase|nr:ATP-binding protein [Terriglobales bacterium]
MKLASTPSGGISRNWRLWWSVAGLVIIVGAAAWWINERRLDPARASKPFRVGYQQAPPYQYLAADGSPAGPAIEIFTEAARRRHIPIEWVHAPEGPEPNLISGKVDLWPLIGDLPERRKFLYISDPWINLSFWMISLESSGISTPKDTAGRSVWHVNVSIFGRLARANFPGARLTPQPSNLSVLEAVCSGKADAGVISGSKADVADLRGVQACQNAQLKFYFLPKGNIFFGIGATHKRPGADRAADAIRAEIGEMAYDGTLSGIYYRSFMDPSNESLIVFYLTEARQRNFYMGVGICLLAVVLALLGWQTLRVRTARRIADAANVALEEQVAVRTAELTEANKHLRQEMAERKRAEETLRRAQKMEAVGRLAGGIAHDFNNLLTIITGCNHLLREEIGNDPALLEKVDAISKAGDRASSLIRQLLAFGRRQVTLPKVLSLNDVLSDMSEMLHRLLREDIALTISTDSELGLVQADPAQIEQVLMNLVINSRDAMPNGGKLFLETANVTLEEEFGKHKPGPYVRLTVSDTGTGMDAETQAHVFEPFFTTKGQGKGTGLGLATVYGIAEQAGGHIILESAVGQGTTFHLFLPRVAGAASTEMRATNPSPARGWETILVVEDQEGVRTLVCEVLRKSGYTVLLARDGREALELSEKSRGRIDLIVTDVVMPQMGGHELARLLASSRPETKVLYMSGYVDKELRPKEMSGLAFIHKPFTPDALAQKVREVLDAALI